MGLLGIGSHVGRVQQKRCQVCSWLLGGEERGRGEGWGAVRNLTSQALPVGHLLRDGMMWTCHPVLTHPLNPPLPCAGVGPPTHR